MGVNWAGKLPLSAMKQTIETVLPPCLTLVIGFVVSPFLKGVWDYAANAVLPGLSPQARLSLLATLAILCLVEGAWIWALVSKKMLLKKYEPDKRWSGIYRHKKSGEMVCGTCLHKGIISLIAAASFHEFTCGICKLPIRENYRIEPKATGKKIENKI